MRNTKWMVMCLFIGFLMAAGMMSTIPIYMDASLQRLLVKDMEEFQLDTGKYPGQYIVEKELPVALTDEARKNIVTILPDFVADEIGVVGIPVDTNKTVVGDNYLYMKRGGNSSESSATRVHLSAMTGLEDHITITQGRMYSQSGIAEDGSYEAVLTETALRTLGVVVGGTYEIVTVDDTQGEPVRMTVVGVFEQSDEKDTYWSEGFSGYVNSIFVPSECFVEKLMNNGTVRVSEISVIYNLNYHSVDMNSIDKITAALREDFTTYSEMDYDFSMDVYEIIRSYVERASSLTAILWAIQIPTMVMLAFYLFMVSRLNVERERNEIAVLKSRGASPWQIFRLYAMEAGILGLVTLIFAPFIGLLLCQFLGVSNGFLEFVNRTGIAAEISLTAVIYALLAVVVFFFTTMIPIIPASKLTIVQYKQSKTKVGKLALWEKLCIDVLLIAAAVVFYILYGNHINQSIIDGSFTPTGTPDPLIFIAATCLVLGLALLFIRVYPYLLKLIYRIGRPFWSASQYMALTTVSTQGSNMQRFLMVFLVITFSFGLFSANTARAINNNKEDRIYYQNGADITLTEFWVETSYTVDGVTTTEYKEKDFSRFEELSGVESATKVFVKDKAKIKSGKASAEGTVMAIEPDKFAATAWFRNGLLPIHWFNYCNALTDFQAGVLISTAFAEENGVELGDEIQLKWGSNDNVEVTVLAIIDYWPGINPNQSPAFAVMNYNYAYNNTALEPYEVWLKLSEGATSEALYADISEKRIPIESITDSSQRLIAEKTEPSLQGMNGGLTLGFVIIMIMSIIGFLIYWILSIKGRTLQFGILRAMGVKMREIIGILGYEQILVSGVSIAVAFVIGGVVSDLFVPMFQSMYAVVDQIPPFRVAAMQSDYIKIYTLIVIMLGGGFAILGTIIKKININKALKLGED